MLKRIIIAIVAALVIAAVIVAGLTYRKEIERKIYCFLREKGDDATACIRDNPNNEPRPPTAPIPDSKTLDDLIREHNLKPTPATPAPSSAPISPPVPAPTPSTPGR